MAPLRTTHRRAFRAKSIAAFAGGAAFALALVGCSQSKTSLHIGPPPTPPPYTGRISTLFDDSVSPRFINPSYSSLADEMIQPRLFEADAVVKGMVRTVDAETHGGVTRYRLGLGGLTAVAGEVPGGTLSVVIAPENPAYGMIRKGRQRLIGQRAIVIVKYFEDPEMGTVSHFRIEPDDQTTQDALSAARL